MNIVGNGGVMKAYKAFDYNWRCHGFQYEVGETYTYDGELEICKKGFHGCERLDDCFTYYPCVQWNKFAEVELLGTIIGHDRDSKKCTNKIRIVREIPFEEIDIRMGSSGISDSTGINGSWGVMRSEGINGSDGICMSKGIDGASGVKTSHGVSVSWGVAWSDGVRGSHGVGRSACIIETRGVAHSVNITRSDGIAGVGGATRSQGIAKSIGVMVSYGVTDSIGILECEGIAYSIFSKGVSGKHYLFNKQVEKERIEEVSAELKNLFGDWFPSFNNLKELYSDNWESTPITLARGMSKEEAWKNMPKQAVDYLKSLPEFNAELFREITGLEEAG